MYLHSVMAKESLLNHQVSRADTEVSERTGSTDSEGVASVRRSLHYFNSDSVSKLLARMVRLKFPVR